MSATEEPRRPPAGNPTEEEGDELERLSTQELHDRAVSWAERHLDVRFFWSLLQYFSMTPRAEVIACTGSSSAARWLQA